MGQILSGVNRLLFCNDWREIDEDGKKEDLIWKIIPPSAQWWSRWWENLITVVKDLLKNISGRESPSYELNTVLCDCTVNSRPITHISEENNLEPLTPSMFFREHRENGIPDLDHLEVSSKSLSKRRLYRCKLEDLRSLFRLEYLGQLRQQTKKIRNTREIKVGKIVIPTQRVYSATPGWVKRSHFFRTLTTGKVTSSNPTGGTRIDPQIV
ncbi:hypothetical protein AVEN_211500-1 [Araneus ventricosus]|uniref:DUF5641 domain-containing protein n=1 Tax=Araneus ventricosus TaxID=182803 RepID=A0A4Y2NFA4_ARAVE|nr:hypothetical protein AVEN_211500-1 [Araneus ventricosus]